MKKFNKLDVLFLNAGISATIRLDDMKDMSIIEFDFFHLMKEKL